MPFLYGQQFLSKHYTAKDGLAHDITYQIIQDSKGYIWIGTDDGLSRFNGTEFKNYTYENGLKSNYVIDVIESQSNDFFMATWGEGLHRLKQDTIIEFTKIKSEKKTPKISKIVKANDSIFYACAIRMIGKYNIKNNTQKNLAVVNKTRPEIKEQNDSIKAVNIKLELKNNRIYILNDVFNNNLNSLKGLYTLKNDSLCVEFNDFFKDKIVHGIADTNSNNTYVSSNNIIYHFRGDEFQEKITLNLPGCVIFNLELNENIFHFIAYNSKKGSREAYTYNTSNKKLKNLNLELGINTLVSDILLDNKNSLWITTYGQGVYYLPKTKTKFLGSNIFNIPDLKDITVVKNNVYVLSPNMLYELKQDTLQSTISIPFHVENIQKDTLKNTLNLISYTNKFKEIKLSTGTTLKVKNTKDYFFQNKYHTIELKNNIIKSYYKDDLKYEWEVHTYDSYIREALVYDNKVYVVYDRIGIYIFDLKSGKLLEKWNKENGYFTNKFYDILIYDNTFWLASDMGLISVKNKELKRYTTHDGLLSNHVRDIFLDHHNVLWLGTQRGLNVMYKNLFYIIDESKGQKSSFITKIEENNDFILAIGNNGLFKYNNKKAFKPISSSAFVIEQKHTLFNIDVVNFNNPSSVQIQYQINDEKWQTTTSSRLDFNRLKHGDYKILFRVKDSASLWKYSSLYSFQLRELWYKRPYFYVFGICLFLAGIIYIIYKRLKISERRNKLLQKALKDKDQLQLQLSNVRHQIAKDFHDDLGNKLASISITSNLLLKNKDNYSEKTSRKLQQINEDSNTLYGGMRDFMWALNYNNNTLNELQMYLSEFGEQLFKNTNIIFKSNNHISENDIQLPYYWNKQLVLIFKETLTNSYKHSRAKEVVFEVDVQKNILKISVIDDGIGFNETDLKHINGIQNMKERAKSINGNLSILINNGTSVVFKGVLK